MIRYLDLLMLPAALSADRKLPQIVGLTASLGVGRGDTLQMAECHIIRMGANLDAQVISQVTKNRDDLELHVNVPRDGRQCWRVGAYSILSCTTETDPHGLIMHLWRPMSYANR